MGTCSVVLYSAVTRHLPYRIGLSCARVVADYLFLRITGALATLWIGLCFSPVGTFAVPSIRIRYNFDCARFVVGLVSILGFVVVDRIVTLCNYFCLSGLRMCCSP